MGGRALAFHAGVHAAEAGVQHRLELGHGEVCDRDLADLRDDHEAAPRDFERARQLDVAREDEHQFIAGAEAVVRVHRTAEVRLEFAGGGAKDVEAEDLPADRVLVDAQGGGVGGNRARRDGARDADAAGGRAADAECPHRVQDGVARDGIRRPGGAARQIGVEQVRRVPLGGEPGADLVRRQAAGGQLVAELVDELGVLQHLLRLLRGGHLRGARGRERRDQEDGCRKLREGVVHRNAGVGAQGLEPRTSAV